MIPLALALLAFQAADGERLSTADLPAYLDALQPASGEAKPVGFQALWDDPEAYRGQRVRVEGRLARRFAQPAFGAFPALVEAWIATPRDNLICAVYPDNGDPASLPIGSTVQFTGTSLRRVRYQGGDGPRLAPLLVGGDPPVPAPKPEGPVDSAVRVPSWVYWTSSLVVLASVGLLAAWLQIQGSSPRSGRPVDPSRVEFDEDDE